MKKFLHTVITSAILVMSATSAEALQWGELEGEIKNTIESLSLGRHYIETEYRGGTLTVSGYVKSEVDRARVVSALSRLHGIEVVKDNLEVKQAGPGGASDADEKIRSAALEAIKELTVLGSYEVDVQVENGVVYLSGAVTAERDRARIERAVDNVAGVKEVQNRMLLEVRVDDSNVEKNIRAAWARESDLDSKNVAIEVVDGIVTLRGAKDNHRTIDRLLSIANMAEGVREVKSEMTIKRD